MSMSVNEGFIQRLNHEERDLFGQFVYEHYFSEIHNISRKR
jgi:hypothetical protein